MNFPRRKFTLPQKSLLKTISTCIFSKSGLICFFFILVFIWDSGFDPLVTIVGLMGYVQSIGLIYIFEKQKIEEHSKQKDRAQ